MLSNTLLSKNAIFGENNMNTLRNIIFFYITKEKVKDYLKTFLFWGAIGVYKQNQTYHAMEKFQTKHFRNRNV